MNKKSLISMLVSLCLVGVIGLGATFAYLSTTTGTLTNTFTVGNVNGTLLEEVPDGADADSANEVVTAGAVGTNTGYAYANLLPGQPIVKAPYMTITNGSANAFAFIKVTGLDELVTKGFTIIGLPSLPSDDWKKIVPIGTGTLDGVYKCNTLLVAGTTTTPTSTSKLFTEIRFNTTVEGSTLAAVNNIVIQGCLVQADYIASDDSTDEVAANKFGVTLP